MVLTWTHGIEMDSWYRHGLLVLTTPMVLTQTHGIVLVLLNQTRTRGTSVTRMRTFFNTFVVQMNTWRLTKFNNIIHVQVLLLVWCR